MIALGGTKMTPDPDDATVESAGKGLDEARAPSWFSWALSMEPRESHLEVDGCAIRVLQWGKKSGMPLVFVHGNGAHARWWSFIAPFFAGTRSIASFDLGGMGDSGRRPDYAPHHFAAEIAAVVAKLAAEGAVGPADVVAHSFGGLVATFFAHARPDLVRSLIIIDTPFMQEGDYRPSWRSRGGRKRMFESRQQALESFRLLPPQDCENLFLLNYVAKHSIRRTEEGWTWKFSANPWNFAGFREGFWAAVNLRLEELEPPVAFIRGAESALCDERMVLNWCRRRGPDAPVIIIPGARHHVMLDQPLALISVVRTLLLAWANSQQARNAITDKPADSALGHNAS